MIYRAVLDGATGVESDVSVRRVADGAFIPFDEKNLDYQAYLAWLAEGNEPDELI